MFCAGLWIRIDLMRIRTQYRYRIQGFDDQKLKINLQLKINWIFFLIKIAIKLSLGLHKIRTSYRKSLQLSKKKIQHFKTWKFFTFFYVCRSFLPSWIRIQKLKLMRIRLRIHNPVSAQYFWIRLSRLRHQLVLPDTHPNPTLFFKGLLDPAH